MLFVDDNPAELAEVVARYPVLGVVQATSPATTASILRQYPGLFGFRASGATGTSKTWPPPASGRRPGPRRGEGPGYLASLEMRLDLAVDPPDGAYRLSELSNRTNQFNTALLRLNEAVQAAAYIEAADRSRSAWPSATGSRTAASSVPSLFAVATRRSSSTRSTSAGGAGRGLEQLIVVESLVRALPYLAGTGTDPFACAVRFAFHPATERPGPWNTSRCSRAVRCQTRAGSRTGCQLRPSTSCAVRCQWRSAKSSPRLRRPASGRSCLFRRQRGHQTARRGEPEATPGPISSTARRTTTWRPRARSRPFCAAWPKSTGPRVPEIWKPQLASPVDGGGGRRDFVGVLRGHGT